MEIYLLVLILLKVASLSERK
ncbi:hypothetical protein Gotur_017651, partial [Gossypium turneri]